MNDGVPRHPEAQIMAAFVDGTLDPSDVAAVAAHLRECSDCRTVAAETARFEREESEPRSRFAGKWAAAAAVAAAIVAALIVTFSHRNAPPIAQLIAASPREHRTVDARLSGFKWARLAVPERGVNTTADPADLKLAGAAGDVLQKSSDPHATGVAYLLIDHRSEAVTALERASRDSKDAHVWSDLAAARYAFATRDAHPSQLPEALADADHALRLDPKLAEALFNRALIIEAIGARDVARIAWRSYLDADSGSAWAVEAREHLRKLEQQSRRFDPHMLETIPAPQLVREFPQETRLWSEGLLLAQWADGDETRLTIARNIGNALADRLLADQVALIDHADAQTRATLASGHRLYRDGRLAYSKFILDDAERKLTEAAALFARASSPMSNVASYYAANVITDANRSDEAREILLALAKKTDAARYPAHAAEIHWQLATCANIDGDWDTAAREAAVSAAAFRRVGERANAAFQDGTVATALERLGQNDESWTLRTKALPDLDARPLSTTLHAAAITLASVGRTEAASSMLNLVAGEHTTAAQLAFIEADRARYASRGGDVLLARESLASARTSAARIRDAALRDTVSAQMDLAEANIDPGAATAIDRTIEFFSERGAAQLPEAYLARARAMRVRGDEGAAAAYVRALDEVEKQRTRIHDAESRMRFLDTAADIVDESIALLIARGDVRGAFAIAERAHAHSSADLARLDPRTALIEYSVLPHEIVAFVLAHDELTAKTTPIDRSDLDARVAALIEQIRARKPLNEIAAGGSALHQLLIEPVRARLGSAREIVIVADRALNELPFAALWDANAKRYLCDELIIRYAQSAARSDETSAPLAPAVVFADPPTTLPRLPASRDEAARIAALQGARLIAGDAATRDAFIDAARQSALIHFAGHADSDAYTSHAALLLARSESDSGILGASDIERLALRHHPLVVLAACGTVRGSAHHVAGMSSLARAFLAAGARGVAGTLWEIDDDVSAVIFLRFHEHLRAGMPPAAALHAAQLDLMQSSDPRLAHPAAWAPLKLLSGT